MRVTPRPTVGLLAFLVYIAIVAALWKVLGVDYNTVQDTTSSVIKGIVIPVGTGAVFLAGYTTYLGWWTPVMLERPRTAPRWTIVVTLLYLVAALISVATSGTFTLSASHVLVLALGCALVGFSEEIMTRGLMLVGFRGGMSEGWVWFLTCALFGLLHGLNVLFGQSLSATIRQIGFAFVAGTALYVVRMAQGALLPAMVLHGLWDFGTLGADASNTTTPLFVGLLFQLTLIVSLVAAWQAVRAKKATLETPHAVPA
jgi:membrane protease YdiL (CAAX protease family)